MSEVRRVFTQAPWERRYGYCRALRMGDRVLVTGTAPVAEGGGVHAPGDAEAQARRCWQIVAAALAELDAGLEHVVRTRMYVTDISQADAYGRVHGELFGAHPPCTTLVEVKGLIDPEMLIEVEVEAWVSRES